MPTRNINLTRHFDKFLEEGVASGRFGDAGEAVREGLRLLEQREKEEKTWLKYVAEAAQEGIGDIKRGDYTLLRNREDIDNLMNDVFREALQEIEAGKRKSA